jgi:hypothetical protein
VIDTNWYTDSAATYHIIGEVEKHTTKEKYKGIDQIVAANGTGMDIYNVGHAVIHTPTHNIYLCSPCSKCLQKSHIYSSFFHRQQCIT